MRKRWLAAAALVLLATACRAEANFGLDVAENGSGRLTAELGVDDELLGLLEDFGGGTDDILAEITPEAGDVETRREDDMTFYSVVQPFANTAELENMLAEFEDSDLTFRTFQLDVADGGAQLDAVIEAPDAADAAGDVTGGLDIAENILSSRLTVHLPGELVESNADEVLADGGLRWDLPVTGGVVDIHAVTEAPGNPFPWVLVIGGLALLVVAGAVAWYLLRRNAGARAIAETPAPAPPEPVFDQPDPIVSGDE